MDIIVFWICTVNKYCKSSINARMQWTTTHHILSVSTHKALTLHYKRVSKLVDPPSIVHITRVVARVRHASISEHKCAIVVPCDSVMVQVVRKCSLVLIMNHNHIFSHFILHSNECLTSNI